MRKRKKIQAKNKVGSTALERLSPEIVWQDVIEKTRVALPFFSCLLFSNRKRQSVFQCSSFFSLEIPLFSQRSAPEIKSMQGKQDSKSCPDLSWKSQWETSFVKLRVLNLKIPFNHRQGSKPNVFFSYLVMDKFTSTEKYKMNQLKLHQIYIEFWKNLHYFFLRSISALSWLKRHMWQTLIHNQMDKKERKTLGWNLGWRCPIQRNAIYTVIPSIMD